MYVFFSRPHKHPDGTRTTGRLIWELFHKNVGRLGLILALINITLGLFLAVAPVAAWAVWFALLGTFVILYLAMEVRLQLGKKNTKTAAIPMKWFCKMYSCFWLQTHKKTHLFCDESLVPVHGLVPKHDNLTCCLTKFLAFYVNGIPHYNLLLWSVPKTLYYPFFDIIGLVSVQNSNLLQRA